MVMTKVIDYDIFQLNLSNYIQKAKKNKFFIYPTDTIYGIGAIASLENCKKIDEIKKRKKGKKYSVIAPGINWIKENFQTPNNFDNLIKKYIDKYNQITLLCKRKDQDFLDFLSDNEKVGIRLIDHNFQNFVDKLWQPFLTTSVNISGDKPVTRVSQVPSQIFNKVDFVVDDGVCDRSPSTIVDMETQKIIRE